MVKLVVSVKVFYGAIIALSLILISVGVYAYGTNNPSVMGHSLGELQVPGHCANGQYLGIDGSGDWNCFTPSSLGTPPTCTGDNQGISWSGSSWQCKTLS